MKRSMLQIYIKNSGEALAFYQDAFGAALLCDYRNEDGSVAHAELSIFGQVLAICETLESEVTTGNTMQFCLDFGEGTETLVQGIIEKLSIGGQFTHHGATDWSPLMADVIDKFGVRWCIFV